MKEKIEKLKKDLELKFAKDKYLEEALLFAIYENRPQNGMLSNIQNKCISRPYKRLENVGDRVIKLILTENMYNFGKSLEEMSEETNKYESNGYLKDVFNILPYAFTKKGDNYEEATCDGLKKADLIEALIGALYLSEYEDNKTFNEARYFVEKFIKK